jgi:DnaK suppressor protein
MSRLDAKELTRLRDRLLALAAELRELEESSREAAETVDLDQSRQGRLSRIDALQGQAMSLAARERRRAELSRIEAALARIDAGTFGDCVVCGEPIAPQRLELDPSTPMCITCASEAESG